MRLFDSGVGYKIMRIFFFISILTLVSCKSYYLSKYCKPETIIIDSTRIVYRDSLIEKEKLVITPPTVNTIYVENPCDSATGKLKPGVYKTGSGNNTTTTTITDTGITVNSNCEESIKYWKERYHSVIDSVATSHTKETTVEKELTWWERFRLNTSFLWWIGLAACGYIIYRIGKIFTP